MISRRFRGAAAAQWVETGIIAVLLGLVLYIKPPHLALSGGYGLLRAALSAITTGFSVF